MRLVGHQHNVVVGVERLRVGTVEFLYQRENKAGIPAQLCKQVLAVHGDMLSGAAPAQQAAVLKGVADLTVQLLAVGQDHNRGRTDAFPPDFPRKERHRIAFAAPLRMPEHAQFAVSEFPRLIRFHRLVDAQILVVPRQYFDRAPVGVVVQDEVLEQVKEILFPADAQQNRFQRDAPLLLLPETLPVVEKLVLAPQRPDFGFRAVGEHHKGVVIEQARNGVLIIAVVVLIGGA